MAMLNEYLTRGNNFRGAAPDMVLSIRYGVQSGLLSAGFFREGDMFLDQKANYLIAVCEDNSMEINIYPIGARNERI